MSVQRPSMNAEFSGVPVSTGVPGADSVPLHRQRRLFLNTEHEKKKKELKDITSSKARTRGWLRGPMSTETS